MRKEIIVLFGIVLSCISIYSQNTDFEAIKSNTTTIVSKDRSVKKVNLVAIKLESDSVEAKDFNTPVLKDTLKSNLKTTIKGKSIIHRNLSVTVLSKEPTTESSYTQKIAISGDKTHKKSKKNRKKVTLTAIPLTED